jgi:hypothetical protein
MKSVLRCNNENFHTFLYYALKHDGKKELESISFPEQEMRWVIICAITPEMMNNYAIWVCDKFPRCAIHTKYQVEEFSL